MQSVLPGQNKHAYSDWWQHHTSGTEGPAGADINYPVPTLNPYICVVESRERNVQWKLEEELNPQLNLQAHIHTQCRHTDP